MGLLDMIFGADQNNSGGLLGGLPREWQYQNPPSQGFPSGPIFAGQPQGPLTPTERQLMALVQPGASSPQAATGAPAAAAPPPPVAAPDQADPLAIGRYQMPRMGAADLYEPDDTTPATARPTQGTAPQAPTTFMQPPSSGGFGGAARGALANLQGGPLGLIAGALAGGLGMGQGTPAAILQQQQNMTAQALLQKGADPLAVQAAMGSPERMGELFKQHFGPDRFQHVTVKNPDGSESAQAFDPSTGKYSGGTGPQPQSKFSVDPELTGQARLEALRKVDPLYARKIESMVAGDLPMPTGVAALRPDAKRQIEDALAVDGSTSASDFQTRAATRRDYASGIASRVTKSINTTIGHFATLDNTIDKLGNYTYFPRLSNMVHDVYSSNTDPAYQKAKATFETNKEAAIKELDYALSGGHSSVSGSAEIRDKFNRADSPETLHAAVTEAMSLLEKRLQSHTKAFTEGTKSQRDPQDFIYPENRQAFSRMLGEKDQGAQAAPGLPSGWTVQVH